MGRISGYALSLAWGLALLGCTAHPTAGDAGGGDASGNAGKGDAHLAAAAPVVPYTFNGTSVGNAPNLTGQSTDAGTCVWGVPPDGGLGCVAAGGGSSPTTTNDIQWDGGYGLVVGAQDASVQFEPNGSIQGFHTSPTGYCLGWSGNSSNWTTLGLGFTNCSNGQAGAGAYALGWDGTNTMVSAPGFGGALEFQINGDTFAQLAFSSGYGNWQFGATQDFGAGAGVVSINKAGSNPTCSSFAHGSGLYSDSSTGKLYLCNDGVGTAIDLSNPAPVSWANDLVGSTSSSQTVSSAQSGEFAWSSGGTETVASSATWLMKQASTSGATGANFTIQPQQSSATPGTGGNFVINLQAPNGAGNEAGLLVTRGGTPSVLLGPYPGGGGSYNGIWFGTPASAPSSTNFAFLEDAAGNDTYLNGGAAINLAVGNSVQAQVTSGNLVAYGNLSVGTSSPSLGGGNGGVFSLANATTLPTSLPTGGVVIAGDSTLGVHVVEQAGAGGSGANWVTVPIAQGTAASQRELVYAYGPGYATTTTSTAVTVLTIPVASRTFFGTVSCSGRCESGSGCTTTGAMFGASYQACYRVVSSTLGACQGLSAPDGFQQIATPMADSSMTSAGITATTSGTNLLIQATGLASANIDWMCVVAPGFGLLN